MSSTLRIGATIALFVLSLAGRGVADDSDASRAEALFREGRAAEKAGDFDTACARFRESETILPTPGTSLNLALCDERAGHPARAHARYVQILDALPSGDSRVELVRSNLAAVSSRVARLRLTRGSHAPPELSVELDSAPLASDPFQTEHVLDPGSHVVVARAGKGNEFRTEMVLAAGERRVVVVDLPASRGATMVPSQPPRQDAVKPTRPRRLLASSRDDSRTVGWAVLGVGGASLVVGGVAGFIVLDRKATMNAHCNDDVACDDEGLDAARSGRTWSVVSTIGLGVGAVGAGVGIYLLTRPENKSSAQLQLRADGISLMGRL